jgi:hypothetical protein
MGGEKLKDKKQCFDLCVLFKIGVLLLKVLSIINKYGLHLA